MLSILTNWTCMCSVSRMNRSPWFWIVCLSHHVHILLVTKPLEQLQRRDYFILAMEECANWSLYWHVSRVSCATILWILIVDDFGWDSEKISRLSQWGVGDKQPAIKVVRQYLPSDRARDHPGKVSASRLKGKVFSKKEYEKIESGANR